MFERFTRAAREVVVQAQVQAREAGSEQVGTEHLLLALLDPGAGLSHEVLTDAGVTAPAVRAAVDRLAGAPPGAALGPDDAAALRAVGIDLEQVLRRLEESFGAGAVGGGAPHGRGDPAASPRERRKGLLGRRAGGHLWFDRRARKVLELSLREAIALGHREIGSAHLLLGLLREGGGLGARALVDSGSDLVALRGAVLQRFTAAA